MKQKIIPNQDTPCCPKMGRPKDMQKQIAILEAAAMLTVEKGFEGTSMDDVARCAGVSKQTVYSHFKNKTTLFKEAVSYYSQKLLTFGDIDTNENATLKSDLTQFANSFVTLINSPPSLAVNRIVMGSSKNSRKLAQLFYEAGPKACRQSLGGLLKKWNDKGALKIENIALATAQFISLLSSEDHYLLTLGLKECCTEAEQTLHVEQSIEAFLKIYAT